MMFMQNAPCPAPEVNNPEMRAQWSLLAWIMMTLDERWNVEDGRGLKVGKGFCQSLFPIVIRSQRVLGTRTRCPTCRRADCARRVGMAADAFDFSSDSGASLAQILWTLPPIDADAPLALPILSFPFGFYSRVANNTYIQTYRVSSDLIRSQADVSAPGGPQWTWAQGARPGRRRRREQPIRADTGTARVPPVAVSMPATAARADAGYTRRPVPVRCTAFQVSRELLHVGVRQEQWRRVGDGAGRASLVTQLAVDARLAKAFNGAGVAETARPDGL